MYDICAFGDALIDMFHGDGENTFLANCSGTALNMIVCATRLGLKTTFISKIGDDVMGKRIENSLFENGVDLTGMKKDASFFTTMTFVELNQGERNFSFARQHGADSMIYPEDIDENVINESEIFHYSGMMLTNEPVRSTTFGILKKMHEKGKVICTDISYREKLWENEKKAIEVYREALPYTDLVKASDEEAFLVSGKDNLEEAAQFFIENGCKICIITCGKDGAFWYMDGKCGLVPTFSVKVVDTTGAGDAFWAGFLYKTIKEGGLHEITAQKLPGMVKFGNAVGALNVMHKGGIDGAPQLEDVEKLLVDDN